MNDDVSEEDQDDREDPEDRKKSVSMIKTDFLIRSRGKTLRLQNIHKFAKHTSKISSSSRFIHKTFI